MGSIQPEDDSHKSNFSCSTKQTDEDSIKIIQSVIPNCKGIYSEESRDLESLDLGETEIENLRPLESCPKL